MTGFLDTGANPISRLTIGAFEDLGYTVDYAAADAYRLPSAGELITRRSARELHGHDCVLLIPEQHVLPESALVD
jgi:hypothetical protein